MLIFEGLMPSHLAKKLMQALLALLSTGGEVKRIFKASLYTPVTSFSMTGVVLLQRNGIYYRRA